MFTRLFNQRSTVLTLADKYIGIWDRLQNYIQITQGELMFPRSNAVSSD